MPYIESENREFLDKEIKALKPATVGELNYCITKLCLQYAKRQGHSYSTFNSVLGVLTAVTHELYRRVVVPYEESKKEMNGDIL